MASTDGCSAIQLTGMKSLQSLYEARLMEAISLLVAESTSKNLGTFPSFLGELSIEREQVPYFLRFPENSIQYTLLEEKVLLL